MTSLQIIFPMRQPWVALGFPVRGKGQWAAELKRILHETPHGQKLLDVHHSYVMAAFTCHPDAEEKVGCGFSHFETGPGPDKYGSTCFHLVRVDGSHATFSVKACLGATTSPWAAFCAALRDAVSLDVLGWKTALPAGSTCALCGCTPRGREAHADHAYPDTFNSLAKEFLEHQSVDLDSVEYADTPMWELADEGIKAAWVQFHRANAKLRLLCSACNSRIGARTAT